MRRRSPAFFTHQAAAQDLACPGGSALILPFPRFRSPEAMVWQQAAGMSFAMPGGYFIAPGANGRAAPAEAREGADEPREGGPTRDDQGAGDAEHGTVRDDDG